MIRFYAPDIETTLTLPEIDSGHCCRVLRKKVGDKIEVVDGRGCAYVCSITNAHPKGTEVEIIEKRIEKPHWEGKITIAVAPTKNIDRMEWMLEKATEIGVDEIVFLKCDHSERKEIKAERLEKILISAMKQSMKAKLPIFEGMKPFKDFIVEDRKGNKFMGYCSDQFERKEFVKEYAQDKDVTILIGPEGDFSEEEVSRAIEAGFIPVTFGETRLRTETAALYALVSAHAKKTLMK